MAVEGNEAHRSGPLKQQNKSHKHGKHRSKGTLDKQTKGRVCVKSLSRKGKQAMGKANRRHHAKQVREKKRGEILEQKRKIGKQGSPPHVIAILPLSSTCNVSSALQLLRECDEEASIFPADALTTLVSHQLKKRFMFLPLKHGDMYSILDAAKVADTILFLVDASNPVDDHTENTISCILAQGLPATFHAIQGLEQCPPKKRNDIKKAIHKLVEKRFPKDKPHSLDTKQDALTTLRLVSNQQQRSIRFRDQRPHLVAQGVVFEPDANDVSKGTLKVTGFVRGQTLSANRLVHLAGYGDFQISQIDSVADSFSIKKSSTKDVDAMNLVSQDSMSMEENIKVIDRANPAFQESLQSEVVPDPMEGEQTWPTEEELQLADGMFKSCGLLHKRVPKGTSEYQASWIIDEENDDDDDDDDDDGDGDDHSDIRGYIGEIRDGSDSDDSMVCISVSGAETDISKYDDRVDVDEERLQLEKLRAARENEMFPDELDTPLDTAARVRFQKFRGLKSFRTSPWDPKENLPSDYARIFQFENFNRTKKRVLSAEEDTEGAMPGCFVTVHIVNVPKAFIDSFDSSKPLVVFGLLPHEQKMSVVHFVIKRLPSYTDPIKSKERLVFHCGYRRFTACPIFSQHTSGDKHKYERFLPQDAITVASMYAPIMFPPCPVMVFNADRQTGSHTLVATGSLYKVDPNRIIAKKIVLSGHPYKINKRSAVIRYLFFNREDIMWFKPVELYTKHGRRGHIKEPLGTHGHMKCSFDGALKAQDTVCMNLYKRVFPKWTYEPAVTSPSVQQDVAMDT
ncbi:predicted protein [Nematostella vectensis]|uniref:Pre-rRNA-processing protein TSR1 homolog n=1 Tax=Nematostella vectensis TaxID=45351 RepID=A7SGF5_NEMVE|nr:predicted protein [Nematostella vectensis]|eukprot:XP_001629241.1 predicted protein [Nematostella vectensis]